MRYSRMREHNEGRADKNTHRSGSTVLILIIVAAAAYIILATKAGDFLSEKIVAPVVNYFADKNTADEPAESTVNPISPSESMVSAELNFPAIGHYMLQYGVFGSKENAEKAAEELRSIGGAGYISEQDGKFRVIISGYASKADAENVKDRLLSERGMESKILDVTAEEMTCSIACGEEYAEQMKAAAADIPGNHSSMLDTILALDGGSITQEEALLRFSELRSKTEEHGKAAETISEKTEDEFVGAIGRYCGTVSDAFMILDENLSGTALSSALKRVYISTSYAYRDLLQYDTND